MIQFFLYKYAKLKFNYHNKENFNLYFFTQWTLL